MNRDRAIAALCNLGCRTLIGACLSSSLAIVRSQLDCEEKVEGEDRDEKDISCGDPVSALAGLLIAAAATDAAPIADVDLTYWVNNALRHDERVDASEVVVRTERGIVTLSGTVDNLAEKIGNPLLRPLVGRVDLRNYRKIVVIDSCITYLRQSQFCRSGISCQSELRSMG